MHLGAPTQASPRKEFISDFIAKLELFAPHKQDDRLQRNSLWLSMEHIMAEKDNPTTAMIIADYAAQFEVVRWTTPTCGVKSSHNLQARGGEESGAQVG